METKQGLCFERMFRFSRQEMVYRARFSHKRAAVSGVKGRAKKAKMKRATGVDFRAAPVW